MNRTGSGDKKLLAVLEESIPDGDCGGSCRWEGVLDDFS